MNSDVKFMGVLKFFAALASDATGGDAGQAAMTALMVHMFNAEREDELSESEKAWGRIDEFIKNNPDAAVPVSQDDFNAILSADAELSAGLGLDKLNYSEYLNHIQGAAADSLFFQDDYRDKRFLIEGHLRNGNIGVLGADINYYQIGMDTAAAGRSLNMLRNYIVGHNARDIWNGQNFRHNMRQMSSGQYWSKVGYNYYKDSR